MSENKTTAAADPHAGGKEMITDVFVRGARQGWGIAIGSMIPNVLMAFVIIKALQITGLLKIIGVACGPLMAVFGLPGESATVLLAACHLPHGLSAAVHGTPSGCCRHLRQDDPRDDASVDSRGSRRDDYHASLRSVRQG